MKQFRGLVSSGDETSPKRRCSRTHGHDDSVQDIGRGRGGRRWEMVVEGSLRANYFNSGKQFPILVELRVLDARVPPKYTTTRYNRVRIMQIKPVHGVSKCTEPTANAGRACSSPLEKSESPLARQPTPCRDLQCIRRSSLDFGDTR